MLTQHILDAQTGELLYSIARHSHHDLTVDTLGLVIGLTNTEGLITTPIEEAEPDLEFSLIVWGYWRSPALPDLDLKSVPEEQVCLDQYRATRPRR
jgi:hypothetical protein